MELVLRFQVHVHDFWEGIGILRCLYSQSRQKGLYHMGGLWHSLEEFVSAVYSLTYLFCHNAQLVCCMNSMMADGLVCMMQRRALDV